jgi:hypothetical protein
MSPSTLQRLRSRLQHPVASQADRSQSSFDAVIFEPADSAQRSKGSRHRSSKGIALEVRSPATDTPDPKPQIAPSHGPQHDGTGAGWALLAVVVTMLLAVAAVAEAM